MHSPATAPAFLDRVLPRQTVLPQLILTPRRFAQNYRWWLVGLVLAAGADLFTTLWNMRALGPDIEMHVVQRWVSQLLGVEAGVPLAKSMQFAAVLLVAAWWKPWCRWILLACACLYAIAAASNYFLWL